MIELPRQRFDGLVDHAVDGAPEEVCGLLAGEPDDSVSVVESIHRADNAAETPKTEYLIDPAEQLELMDTIEAAGRGVVGFYHSHPAGPPHPSETDSDRAAWPGLSYLIVALDGRHPFVGSWRWDGETEAFTQEVVRLR